MALPQIDTPDYIKQRQENDRLALLGQIADEPDYSNLNFYGYGTNGLIGTALNTLGTGLENINNIHEETGAINNPMLGQSISGDSWIEVLNHNDLNEGIQNVRNQRRDYSNMLNNQNIYDLSNPNEYQRNIQYKQTGPWGAMLKDAGAGASAGSVFGPWGTLIGGVAGVLSGFTRSAISDSQKKRNARILNQQIDRTNLWQTSNRDNAIASNNQRNIRNNMRNYINNPIGSNFQDGGDLGNGVTMFNVGSTHQQNPYGGIPQGIASDGFPNMVEEGEVKYKDYIFSARLKPTKTELKDNVLPEKYAGLTFAKIAEKIQKESEDRANDPISIRTLDEMMGRLTNCQEEHKAKIEERRLAKALDNMSDEEKAALMASLMQQQSVPQNNLAALQGIQPQIPEQVSQEEPIQGMDLSQPMYANGGKIFIKPSKRGTFTAAAKKRGMGVQEFASKVLANKENYSPAMVKKANFAKNAAHWGQNGLNLNIPYPNGWDPVLIDTGVSFGEPEYFEAPGLNPYVMAEIQYATNNNLTNKRTVPDRHIFDYYDNVGNFDNAEFFVNPAWKVGAENYTKAEAYKNLYNKRNAGSNEQLEYYKKLFGEEGPLSDAQIEKILALKDWGTHTPKNRKELLRWLIDETNKANIQDFHEFINSLGIRGTVPQLPKRYWKLEGDTKVPINPDNIPEGFVLDESLNEQGPDASGVNGLDYYYVPREQITAPIVSTTPTTPTKTSEDIEPIKDNWSRLAPLFGGLASVLNRPDYSYPNELSNWLGELQPIAAPSLGGYRRYNPYDVNLANNEAMAQLAAAQRANIAAGNRETQAAGLTALENAYAKENAARNLQWQQANETNRLTTDQYNLGIDQTNLGVIQNYDQLNQDTRNRRVALGQDIAAARDASNTDYAAAQSANLTNLLENLGEIGKENWSRNERNRLLSVWPNIARMYGLT